MTDSNEIATEATETTADQHDAETLKDLRDRRHKVQGKAREAIRSLGSKSEAAYPFAHALHNVDTHLRGRTGCSQEAQVERLTKTKEYLLEKTGEANFDALVENVKSSLVQTATAKAVATAYSEGKPETAVSAAEEAAAAAVKEAEDFPTTIKTSIDEIVADLDEAIKYASERNFESHQKRKAEKRGQVYASPSEADDEIDDEDETEED
jgi:hypothetical protein